MRLKILGFAAALSFALVGCGGSKTDDQSTTTQPNPSQPAVSQQDAAAMAKIQPNVPQSVIMRVPVDAKGNPDFDKVELRSVQEKVATTDASTLAGKFNQGTSAGAIATSADMNEMDKDSSSESHYGHGGGYYGGGYHGGYYGGGYWPRHYGYILPWRQHVANALYGGGYYGNGYGNYGYPVYASYAGYGWGYSPYSCYTPQPYNGYAYYGYNSCSSSYSSYSSYSCSCY